MLCDCFPCVAESKCVCSGFEGEGGGWGLGRGRREGDKGEWEIPLPDPILTSCEKLTPRAKSDV